MTRTPSLAATMLLAAALAAAASLGPRSAQAADPCGVRLDGGQVKSAKPLPARADLAGADLACATAVATALKERTTIRSVTIAVRVASDKRGDGATIATAWTKLLVAAGVPEARISTIVPTSAPGTPTELTIAYREPTPRPVALVQAMTGKVDVGPDVAKLTAAVAGTTLTQGDHVSTDKGAVARLALADGSFVSLLPGSTVKLGRVELTADLKRAVRIDLIKGKVEAIADPKGTGSTFDIVTKTAVAGVRGTKFRVGDSAAGTTSVETLEGKVELKSEVGAKETVVVEAGKAADVDSVGKASAPRDLLKAPVITAPLHGAVERTVKLTWQPVEGAKGYKVDIGKDGELATGLRVLSTPGPELALPAELSAGHWFWRVAALDDGDNTGMPSRTYSFVVK